MVNRTWMEGEIINMKIFGYERNKDILLELEETSIDCTLEELEKLIVFFNEVKNNYYSKNDGSSMLHTHLRDWDKTWQINEPDLIIVNRKMN